MKKTIQTIILVLFTLINIQAQLNPDRHTTSPTDGWLSCTETMNPDPANGLSHWIMIDLQSNEQLTTMLFWNHNDPSTLDNGVDRLKVQYSLDATTWTDAGQANVPISDGSAFYEGSTILDFNGATVRYILMTAISSHGGSCVGFAEVRFYLGQAVPVELASFEGQCENGEKSLSWSFADISDFGSVEVEYSLDGQEWSSIYTTSNTGNEINGIYKNSYSDLRLSNANNHFYKLKMIDINGDYKYSDIIEVTCEIDENDIHIFPNPVSAKVNIDVDLISSENINYSLKDVLGKTIKTGTFQGQEGNNRFSLDTEDLINGNYFISLQIAGKNIEKKIIKLKS